MEYEQALATGRITAGWLVLHIHKDPFSERCARSRGDRSTKWPDKQSKQRTLQIRLLVGRRFVLFENLNLRRRSSQIGWLRVHAVDHHHHTTSAKAPAGSMSSIALHCGEQVTHRLGLDEWKQITLKECVTYRHTVRDRVPCHHSFTEHDSQEICAQKCN